jgi:hypothetical protein
MPKPWQNKPGRGFNPTNPHQIKSPLTHRTRQEIERLEGKINNAGSAAASAVNWKIENDCFSDVSLSPWVLSSSAGSCAASTGNADHPGVIKLKLAADGYLNLSLGPTSATNFLIAGGEKAEFIFQIGSSFDANEINYVYLGYCDGGPPIDAVALLIFSDGEGVMKACGYAESNDVYTLSNVVIVNKGEWYHGTLEVNQDATMVSYTLVGANNTTILRESIASNIPTASGRETSHGIYFYRAKPRTMELYLDYLSAEITREIER